MEIDGKGKYDDACTALRESTQAQCALAIILGGKHGNGFSMQALLPEWQLAVPTLLRATADLIESQNRQLEKGFSQPAG